MTDANKHHSSPAPQPGAEANGDAAGEDVPVDNLLGLKLLVVSMGVLLVVAAITFVILLVLKSNEPEETEPAAITTMVEGGDVPVVQLNLQPGEKIVDMSLDGRSLALRLESSTGERILIIDPYTSDHRAVIEIDRD